MNSQEIFVIVRDCLVARLAVDESEVNLNTLFMQDLGGESIDILDVLHSIEQAMIKKDLPVRYQTLRPVLTEWSETIRTQYEGDIPVEIFCAATAKLLSIEWDPAKLRQG